MKHLLLLVLALVLTGCPASTDPQPPQPPPPRPGPSPTPEVRDTDKCGAAYENLKGLECRDSRGKPMWVNSDDETFDVTCRRIQEEGGVFLDPVCIAEAPTCEEANVCPPSQQ